MLEDQIFCQNVFSVTKIFALFCRRVTKVSSFWPPTKICIFRQELTVFSQKWMQLDAKFTQNVFNLTIIW